ncbi:MAG: hypothetical protein JXR90_17885 [Spirochaetes bacterium]|nr:hypothetical protein [Spirochaetota bacterium]
MRKQGMSKDITNIVSFFSTNFKFMKTFKSRLLLFELPIIVLALLAVIISSYVSSITKFPIEKLDYDKIENIPSEKEYSSAEKFYSQASDFKYLDLNAEIDTIYNDLLNLYSVENDINPIRDYIANHLQSKFNDSFVIIKRVDGVQLSKKNTEYQALVIKQKEKQIDSLKTIMYESSVFLRERYERIIRDAQKTITSIERFNGYLIELGISPQVRYERLNTSQSYNYVAGISKSIEILGTRYNINLKDAKPVLSSDFLKKFGIDIALEKSDATIYETIKLRYDEIRKNLIIQAKNQIEEKVKLQRSLYRDEFIPKHFGNIWFFVSNYYAMILFIITVILALGAINDERKISFKKYFATNILVSGLKIIAVIILCLAIVLAFYNVVAYTFTENKIIFLTEFFGFKNVIFYPSNFFIRLYLFTIGIFITSEFLCFMTSLFNVFYNKSKLVDKESTEN